MYTAITIMFIGMVLGRLLRRTVKFSLSPYIMVVICLLLFVLGLEIGFNEKLLSEFAHIGTSAVLISTLSVIGSVVAAGIFYRFVIRKKFNQSENPQVNRRTRK